MSISEVGLKYGRGRSGDIWGSSVDIRGNGPRYPAGIDSICGRNECAVFAFFRSNEGARREDVAGQVWHVADSRRGHQRAF